MALHWQNLSFDLQISRKNNKHSPQLLDVIKSTIDHQLHQHVKATPSLELSLMNRTKKILSQRYVSPVCASRQENENKEEMNKSKTVMCRSRREWRVKQTKKQLQLLNQFYRSINKDKVRQFCQQIELKQAQIQMTLTHDNFRKTYITSNPKTIKYVKERQIKTSQINPQRITNRTKSQKQKELDVIFDRLKPYRKIQIAKYKRRDLVQNWEAVS